MSDSSDSNRCYRYALLLLSRTPRFPYNRYCRWIILFATVATGAIIWKPGLSNEDENVNDNVDKQWSKLQNTITARGNATTWPLFRRRL